MREYQTTGGICAVLNAGKDRWLAAGPAKPLRREVDRGDRRERKIPQIICLPRRGSDLIPQMTDLPLFVVQRCRQPLRRVSFGLRGRPDSLAVIDLRSPVSGNFSIFSHLGGRRIPHFQRKRFPRNSVGIATLSTSRPHGHWLGNDGAAERELCGGRGR